MKILLISEFLPFPLDNAPKIRLYDELKILAKNHEIHLACFTQPGQPEQDVEAVEQLDVLVHHVPMDQRVLSLAAKAWSSMTGSVPLLIRRWFHRDLKMRIDMALHAHQFDVIHVDHLQMAQYAPDAFKGKKILVTHNVEHSLYRQAMSTVPSFLMRWILNQDVQKLEAYEAMQCKRFDRIVAMTQDDEQELVSMAPEIAGKTSVLPTSVNLDYFKPAGLEKDLEPSLVFTGDMTWRPALDAATWLCREIFPLIQKNYSDTVLHLIGQYNEETKAAFVGNKGIHFHGRVDDVRPYLERAWVFLCPTRIASGIRTKALHAMAMELPVVCTLQGAKGLKVQFDDYFFVGKTAEELAQQCLNLFADADRRKSAGKLGRKAIIDNYSLDDLAIAWEELYNGLF